MSEKRKPLYKIVYNPYMTVREVCRRLSVYPKQQRDTQNDNNTMVYISADGLQTVCLEEVLRRYGYRDINLLARDDDGVLMTVTLVADEYGNWSVKSFERTIDMNAKEKKPVSKKQSNPPLYKLSCHNPNLAIGAIRSRLLVNPKQQRLIDDNSEAEMVYVTADELVTLSLEDVYRRNVYETSTSINLLARDHNGELKTYTLVADISGNWSVKSDEKKDKVEQKPTVDKKSVFSNEGKYQHLLRRIEDLEQITKAHAKAIDKNEQNEDDKEHQRVLETSLRKAEEKNIKLERALIDLLKSLRPHGAYLLDFDEVSRACRAADKETGYKA